MNFVRKEGRRARMGEKILVGSQKERDHWEDKTYVGEQN
jgi:hypothetical protein